LTRLSSDLGPVRPPVAEAFLGGRRPAPAAPSPLLERWQPPVLPPAVLHQLPVGRRPVGARGGHPLDAVRLAADAERPWVELVAATARAAVKGQPAPAGGLPERPRRRGAVPAPGPKRAG